MMAQAMICRALTRLRAPLIGCAVVIVVAGGFHRDAAIENAEHGDWALLVTLAPRGNALFARIITLLGC